MAVNQPETPAEGASGSRMAIGANVVISIVAAIALVAAVNWIASLRYVRQDLASFGNFGMSERTKRILSETPGDVSISVVYAPNPKGEKDEKQQGYIDRLLDYCDELRAFSKKVSVEHISTARQREALAAKINKSLGGEADAHKKALAAFETMRTKMLADLTQLGTETDAILQSESWLSDFPLFAQIGVKVRDLPKNLNDAAEEIKNLTPQGGIPKYAEATNKAKSSASEISTALGAIAKLMGELTMLADEVTKPDSKYIKNLREVAAGVKTQLDSLAQTIGSDGSPPPADVKAALKAYADHAVQVGTALDDMAKKIDDFSKAYPIVRQHANWAARVQNGPMVMQLEVADVMQELSEGLRKARLQLLGIIDSGDAKQLQDALNATRQNTGHLEKNGQVCQQLLTELADRLANVDDASKKLLASARNNGFLKEQRDSIKIVNDAVKSLPELKFGTVADKISEENSVVIEIGGKIRVVDFSSVFPVRESMAGPSGDDKEQARTFNGDSAISSAILALKADKPFAAVTFVSFEAPAPQQRSPFMPPPPQSSIAAGDLSEARARLEAANFKCYDWNLATAKEKPKIEDGLKEILVLLPPAPPAPPNPFGGQQPESPSFGPEQRKIINDLIDKGANALYLGCWEVVSGGFMGRPMTPKYPYETDLEKNWGLRLDNATRILAVQPDMKAANAFTIGVRQFNYMPLTGFSDQSAVGKPMIGTRFYVTECARIEKTGSAPKGVTTNVVASIPKRETYIGVTVEELIAIINHIQDPKGEGVIQMDRPLNYGPFDVMVTGEKSSDDGKTKHRMALMAFGASLRDRYVKQQVLVDMEHARFGPEPKESLDLLVNSIYWLNNTEGYIGKGPVPVPRVRSLSDNEQKMTRAFVWFIWPAVVGVSGIFLWFIRRR